MTEAIEFRPQPGPQEAFLSSSADIVIYGGAAGGGKTYGLLLEPLRHIDNAEYGAVIFRKNSTQITNKGGLWDTSKKVYPSMGATPRASNYDYTFPSGSTVAFRHLEHDTTVIDWQGAQIPLIGFDELTHFSEYQFFYMLSRNRSLCGVKPYVRATTNPDADSWVAIFISWWIDQETGDAIEARSGIIRWMIRINDEIRWFGTYDEAKKEAKKIDDDIEPKSVTFIPSKLDDNKKLTEADPGYKANLYALSSVERKRLLGGNWKIRASGGLKFKKEFFEIVDEYPRRFKKRVRYWDFAATIPKKGKDPDWTVGTDMGIDYDDVIWIVEQVRVQETPGKVDTAVKNTAARDGKKIVIMVEEEGGASGKFTTVHFVKLLKGFVVKPDRPTGSKEVRANPYASYAEAGNIKIVRGEWNKVFLDEHEAFPNPDVHDDTVDSASGGFKYLTEKPPSTTETMSQRGMRP